MFIYVGTYGLFFQSDPVQRDVVYQCLEAILRFCHQHAEPLMYHLCTLLSNYDLVTSTFASPHVSYHFLNFVSTWLRYRRRYCDDEGPWTEKSLRKTLFEETCDCIFKHVNAVKDDKADSALNSLRYAVSASNNEI